MLDMEFVTQIQRLQREYGEKTYTTERLRLIFREVKFLDAKRFETIVDRLIMECRSPPLWQEIAPYVAIERERQWEQDRRSKREEFHQENENPRCPQCRDKGSLMARLKIPPEGHNPFARFAFRCQCQAGLGYPAKFLFWGDHLRGEYELVEL
jgi:hypothetical protein